MELFKSCNYFNHLTGFFFHINNSDITGSVKQQDYKTDISAFLLCTQLKQ